MFKNLVEIDGQQHSKFTPFFHKNKDVFYSQRYRDELKKLYCEKRGLTLINVPYAVGEKGLKPYIVQQLRLHQFLL